VSIVVKAKPRPSGSAYVPPVPKGLRECWLDSWELTGPPSHKTPPGITGIVNGDLHVLGTVTIYNFKYVDLVRSIAWTHNTLYHLTTKKGTPIGQRTTGHIRQQTAQA
jgi:hypothetical protein